MSRQIILLCFAAAALIFLVKLFELKFLSGGLSFEFYAVLIGMVFLAVGVYLGILFSRRTPKPAALESPQVSAPTSNGNQQGLLTARESELLGLLGQGLSNREIAGQLFISENTVKKHLSNLYGKLQVSRRTQAISRAAEMGILDHSAAKITQK